MVKSPGNPHPHIDLVVVKLDDGKYRAYGGTKEAIFTGEGQTQDEAVGSWFRQNRETVNVTFAFESKDDFWLSTVYGNGRGILEAGPHEMKAYAEWVVERDGLGPKDGGESIAVGECSKKTEEFNAE